MRALLHEDATWTPMVKDIPGAGKHIGRKGIVDDFLHAHPRHVPAWRSEGSRRHDRFQRVARHHRDTRDRSTVADGRPYDNQYCWAFEIKDGKVFAIREYMDSLYVSRLFAGT